MRHNAERVTLRSDEPVCFTFPSGEKRSKAPIQHQQIVQLVQEIAPLSAMQEVRGDAGEASFAYKSGATKVGLQVRALAEEVWEVSLRSPFADDSAVEKSAPREQTAAQSRDTATAPSAAERAVASTSQRRGNAPPLPPAWGAGNAGASAVVASAVVTAQAVDTGQTHASPHSSPHPTPPTQGDPAINRFLREMVDKGASDLHLSSTVMPMARIHGEMHPLGNHPELSPEALRALLMEIAPERNQEEYDTVHDTDFAHTVEGVARFRANYFMDRHGIGAVFRQIPFEILSPEKLGLPKEVLDLCWLSKGLVVVTGPTGSGKSTTLATLIDYINMHRKDHIITIEDPIEFVHANKSCLVNQREVRMHTKSFKNALRAALREDPDIVLVGEMRDLETIAIAIETAETGHLVFGTLHTTTAPSTVDRIIDQFPADRQDQIRTMLSESLKGVIAQVLCKKNGGGRSAAYEVLIGNSAVANLIREGKTFQLVSVMQTGRNQGMRTMNDSLIEHVEAGRVDAREAYVKAVDKQGLKQLFQQSNIHLELQ